MRLTRVIGALVGVLAVAAIPAAAAQAATPYPPTPPVVVVDQTTVTAGDSVTVTGRNFAAREIADIDVAVSPLAAGRSGPAAGTNGHAGTAMVPAAYQLPGRAQTVVTRPTTDGTGTFSVDLRLPDPGRVTITATGEVSGLSASVTVTVLPKGHGLPVTGRNLVGMTTLGGGLAVVGAVLVLGTIMWRRRRGGHAAR